MVTNISSISLKKEVNEVAQVLKEEAVPLLTFDPIKKSKFNKYFNFFFDNFNL